MKHGSKVHLNAKLRIYAENYKFQLEK
jgi:hypothetical protein